MWWLWLIWAMLPWKCQSRNSTQDQFSQLCYCLCLCISGCGWESLCRGRWSRGRVSVSLISQFQLRSHQNTRKAVQKYDFWRCLPSCSDYEFPTAASFSKVTNAEMLHLPSRKDKLSSQSRKYIKYIGSSTHIPSTATTPMWSTTSWSSTSTSGGGDLFFIFSEMIFQAPALHEKRARWTVWICGHCQQHRSYN